MMMVILMMVKVMMMILMILVKSLYDPTTCAIDSVGDGAAGVAGEVSLQLGEHVHGGASPISTPVLLLVSTS